MDILLLVVTVLLLLAGFPVAFTLGGVAVLFAGVIALTGDGGFIALLPARIFGSIMINETLIAIPFFVLMGMALEQGRVAEDAFAGLTRLLRGTPRGLVIAVLLVGTLLAASTGIVGATVTTLGLIALPTLLRKGVPPSLACGSVCAAGTLGQIIPPSIALVILGDQIASAYSGAQTRLQQAAWATGDIFTPRSISVGDLFAGSLLPGVMLATLYLAYVLLRPTAWDAGVPQMHKTEPSSTMPIAAAWRALLPPLFLMLIVLGSILAGIAPPSEAAGIGALGALGLAAIRSFPETETKEIPRGAASLAGASTGLIATAVVMGPDGPAGIPFIGALVGAFMFLLPQIRRAAARALHHIGRLGILAGAAAGGAALIIGGTGSGMDLIAAPLAVFGGISALAALHRLYCANMLMAIAERALRLTAMIFAILVGAAAFGLVFRDLGGDETIRSMLNTFPGGTTGAILVVLGIMVLLGLFLDFVEITLIVVPIAAPILLSQPGVDPIWLGVMMALALQTSFMTPPLGYALFYLRGVAPADVSDADIYRGVRPFIGLQLIALCVVWFWQDLATWLPLKIFGL